MNIIFAASCTINDMDYIKEIKVLMVRNDWDVDDVATILKVKKTRASQLINGKGRLPVTKFIDLVNAAGCELKITEKA